jgi:hypothetical protein
MPYPAGGEHGDAENRHRCLQCLSKVHTVLGRMRASNSMLEVGRLLLCTSI